MTGDDYGGKVRLLLLVLTLLSWVFVADELTFADEGMWTLDSPPLQRLKERYGFTPTQEWLDQVRLSSVRFNNGGSGSFVSSDGLVLTNHHIVFGQLQKLSSSRRDYVKEGFFAQSRTQELKCPDLELNVLMSMENVTEHVRGALREGMSEKEALESRKAEIAKIEKESLEATGLRSDVVTLYQGGEYWLYRYEKYTDIRLVFAPEGQSAFFGGDPDNFTFPRYCLDMALVRVYENDTPVKRTYHLKWSAKGASDGELVFVSGHPGSTDRLQTMAQIRMKRDSQYPYRFKTFKRRLKVLKQYAAGGPEQARQAARQVFGIENALKAWTGEYNGLLDKNLISKKEKEENAFRALVESNPEWKKQYGDAWDAIAEAQKKQLNMLELLRFRSLRGSRMARLALNIVQYVAEVKKPDGERLDGFHDSQLDSLRFRLLSPAPVYPDLEETLLADSLEESLQELGAKDPFVEAVLAGGTAAEVANKVIRGTQIADPDFRKMLLEGGEEVVAASTDPLISLTRSVDPLIREIRKWFEDHIESVETTAGEKIGKARFAVYGKSVYPDATFTLRLAYGSVKGYPMNGTHAPTKTTFYGLYDRAYSFALKPPYDLTQRYREGQNRLDLSTPLNFVSSCDIIGGNSGSPVINKKAELVGLIFDGNIESLVSRFIYDEGKNRAIAVHSVAMIEALRQLYDAGALADELTAEESKE